MNFFIFYFLQKWSFRSLKSAFCFFLHRLNLYLSKDLSFSVGVYNLIQRAYKPYPVKLYRETNEPVKTKTRVFNGKTGSLLLPSDTKRAQVMYWLCAFSLCDFGVVAVGRSSAFYCFCFIFHFRDEIGEYLHLYALWVSAVFGKLCRERVGCFSGVILKGKQSCWW